MPLILLPLFAILGLVAFIPALSRRRRERQGPPRAGEGTPETTPQDAALRAEGEAAWTRMSGG